MNHLPAYVPCPCHAECVAKDRCLDRCSQAEDCEYVMTEVALTGEDVSVVLERLDRARGVTA